MTPPSEKARTFGAFEGKDEGEGFLRDRVKG
jgi:hypothetical protein